VIIPSIAPAPTTIAPASHCMQRRHPIQLRETWSVMPPAVMRRGSFTARKSGILIRAGVGRRSQQSHETVNAGDRAQQGMRQPASQRLLQCRVLADCLFTGRQDASDDE
jgi:hypothetical protein